MGPLAEAVVTVAQWAPDLTARKDAFWGDSSAYTRLYLSTYGREPAYNAAGNFLHAIARTATLTPTPLICTHRAAACIPCTRKHPIAACSSAGALLPAAATPGMCIELHASTTRTTLACVMAGAAHSQAPPA